MSNHYAITSQMFSSCQNRMENNLFYCFSPSEERMCYKDQNLIQLDQESVIFKKWHHHSRSNLFPKCRDAFRHHAWLTLREAERDDSVSAYTENDYYSPGEKKNLILKYCKWSSFHWKKKVIAPDLLVIKAWWCILFFCTNSCNRHTELFRYATSHPYAIFSAQCFGGKKAPVQRKAGKNSKLCSNAR